MVAIRRLVVRQETAESKWVETRPSTCDQPMRASNMRHKLRMHTAWARMNMNSAVRMYVCARHALVHSREFCRLPLNGAISECKGIQIPFILCFVCLGYS